MNEIIHDAERGEFRVRLELGFEALVRYQLEGNVMAITSTRVPDDLQGKGYGKVMMETVLPEIEQMSLTVRPVCSYVEHYLNRHPQWAHLVAKP